ncbi:DUF418 domain-containing protein [Sporosarcina ureilytica]|uniref:DUF418 domain-containing protein n=1 Tax=Sporosarcina ureilytica TaxID=298596 RepID=UPI00094C1B9B|nr:DUF418 domain-containing protein [Sporosarcina ureilytica]
MKLTPITPDNRIEALDITRGFALLGIFIANMLLFHTPYFYLDPYTYFTAGSDAATFRWIDIFVQGSFYPIFAFLFGYGINMQYEKAVARNKSFARMMSKRLAILLAFGLIHALFIWSGDVLFSYATMGFLLIIFVRIPAKWLTPFAIVLYTIPAGVLYLITKFIVKTNPNTFVEGFADTEKIERSIEVFANGSFGEIFSFRAIEWLFYGLGSTLLGFFIVLPIIMLGAAMSKWKIIERANEIKGRLVIVAVLATAIGVWIKALPHIGQPTYDLVQLQDTFGGVILAAGYMAILLLLCNSSRFRTISRPVGKAGRMSLTTYLSQSVIATVIFYSYGLGLYGKVDVLTGTFIAIGVFVIQLIFAQLWLSKFRMGPIEALWRFGTYGKNLSK